MKCLLTVDIFNTYRLCVVKLCVYLGSFFGDMDESKKWLIHPNLSPEELQKQQQSQQQHMQGQCAECEKYKVIINEYIQQLNDEKKAMDETILMVEKLETDHKIQINELKLLLNFEKDKVLMLEKSLETERKARIEDLYKQDRERKDYDHISKDYELVNTLNRDMISEFEVLKNENNSLTSTLKILQENKQTILEELKKYEEQLTELEANNQNLRKRLYDTESQRDKYQILIDKLKEKVSILTTQAMTSHHKLSNNSNMKSYKKFLKSSQPTLSTSSSTTSPRAPAPTRSSPSSILLNPIQGTQSTVRK